MSALRRPTILKADLSKTVDIGGMRTLGEPERVSLESVETPEGTEWVEIEAIATLEATGRPKKVKVLVSKPETFAGRQGYRRDFLDGWTISLPEPKRARKTDMLKLRRGGSGFELKYEHFSTVQSQSRRREYRRHRRAQDHAD
jgi:hypothetical protein